MTTRCGLVWNGRCYTVDYHVHTDTLTDTIHVQFKWSDRLHVELNRMKLQMCVTNWQWPPETYSSHSHQLIDLLSINTVAVWFKGKMSGVDNHLAQHGVLFCGGWISMSMGGKGGEGRCLGGFVTVIANWTAHLLSDSGAPQHCSFADLKPGLCFFL